MFTVLSLTCNQQPAPLGLDDPRPVFGWQLETEARAQVQRAYRILVATRADLLNQEHGDLWDSGRVDSDQSVQVRYGGKPLASGQRCWWAVKAWDGEGSESAWSEPAWFEMGLLEPEDWQGQWITHPDASWNEISPAPYFRKNFMVDGPIQRARVYLCGLGYHELYLNGQKVSDAVLEPAFTRYDRRALYVTYDVTSLLREGENVFGVILGNGLFNQTARDAWQFEKSPWRASPRMQFQAQIIPESGVETILTSDASWKTAFGPICFDGTRLGEVYDARLEMHGWSTADFKDAGWAPARIAEAPRGKLSAQSQPPVKVMQTLQPVRMWKAPSGCTIYDFGQNFTGWARIRVHGPAGAEVTLRYGERLHPDGSLDRRDIAGLVYEGDVQVDRFILSGQGKEVYEPRFTYHGFQYLEVQGPAGISLNDVTGCVVHTAFERAGWFECSSPLINKIQAATEWAYISNFVGYPTDCPHREKNGWTGDAHLAAEAGLYNFQAGTAYWKWLDDLADEQREDGTLPGIVPTSGWGYEWGNGPCWDSACILIPWYLYLYRGDRAVLERSYPMMRRYIEYLIGKSRDGIISIGLGDWVPPFGRSEDYTAPLALLATSYFYVDTRIAAQVAGLMGNKADAVRYENLANQIRQAFNSRFYDPISGLYAGGSQTALSMALYAGLPAGSERIKVARQLVAEVRQQKGRINAGIHGAKAILHALAENGFHTQAYHLITQPQYPGWAWWIGQGATTLWECWDGSASRNHIMFGDVSAWFYRYLAGIRPDPNSPGFKSVIIRPFLVEELEWVRAEHHSPYGWIRAAWKRSGRLYRLEVELPVNTTGMVYLPQALPGSLRLDDRPAETVEDASFTHQRTGGAVCKIGSGRWEFTWESV